ncbi:MAG: cytochrome C oxidase subunit IV family protein [Phycisphaerae bacterium]
MSHEIDPSASHQGTHGTPGEGHGSHGGHDGGGMHHVMPLKTLLAVFGTLVVFTVLTVAVTYVDLGNFNLYVAMAIAGVKATLVLLFFMHLLYDRPFNSIVFIGCLVFVTLFISLSLTDISASRSRIKQGQAPAMQNVHKPFAGETR